MYLVFLCNVDSELRSCYRLHLVIETPPSVLSFKVILAVLDQDKDSGDSDGLNLFQKLKLMRKVAQKALENAGSEQPFIAHPACTARDVVIRLDDDSLTILGRCL